jgi:predicted PolB exonuclease-like 3'-5' exonuclease
MATPHWLIVDLSTAPLANAAEFITGTVKAPTNYKKADAIAEYVREEEAKRAEMAGTDIDLARVTGVGVAFSHQQGHQPLVTICKTEDEERAALECLAAAINERPTIITYGGLNFDVPLMMRRARYLGVDFPVISTDRFKSSVVDLCEVLSDRNPQRRRSLQFYARRLGWVDLTKTLQGAEEARVHETGKWTELKASIEHDVIATYRLAGWLGVIHVEQPMTAAAELVGF